MKTSPTVRSKENGNRAMAAMVRLAGVRMTRQRRAVIDAVLSSCDHPTAAALYERAKASEPGLSLATVYNCLETLAETRFVNKLHFATGPCRYCPNIIPHAHVLDDASNVVIDVKLKAGLKPEDVFDLPEGVRITHMDACLHGSIPQNCISKNKQ